MEIWVNSIRVTGPHHSICGPGPGRVCSTAEGPGRAWASNHICLGLDFRYVQGHIRFKGLETQCSNTFLWHKAYGHFPDFRSKLYRPTSVQDLLEFNPASVVLCRWLAWHAALSVCLFLGTLFRVANAHRAAQKALQ